MGVAATLLVVGVVFGVLAVVVDPGAFAVIIAVVSVAAGTAMAVFARTRTGDP